MPFPRGYINLGAAQDGDEIVVEFPMKEWTVTTNLVVLPTIDPGKLKRCQVTLRGNTATNISENVGYPQHVLERNRGDRAGIKKVRRFVSDEHYFWYKQP